jgi:hypothetical protein
MYSESGEGEVESEDGKGDKGKSQDGKPTDFSKTKKDAST